MSPGMTAIPPLPPGIQAQQQQQPGMPAFGRMGPSAPGGPGGAAGPDPIAVLEAQMAKLEQWAAETAPLLNNVSPSLATLMGPIAQAGKAMQTEIASMKQAGQGPSPTVSGSVPPNVPGNIPSGHPAM